MLPSSICWRTLPGVPTTISIALFKESSWGLTLPPPLTMVERNRAWWLIDFATRNTYKTNLTLTAQCKSTWQSYLQILKKNRGTCSDNSLVGHSTTARGRLGLISIPSNASSCLSNYKNKKNLIAFILLILTEHWLLLQGLYWAFSNVVNI